MKKCLNCKKPVNNKYCNVSCQNTHQGTSRANKKYGELKLFDVKCNNCEKILQIKERENLFPKKKAYYCSRACANSRTHSEETKNKIKNSLKKLVRGKRNIDKDKICKECNCKYHSRIKTSKFCSVNCASKFHIRNSIFFTKDFQRKNGLKSANTQKKTKRSKNEIYFGELCEQRFNLVKYNEQIFGGWDADVIIEDLKLAVLWNGKWHYEKITKEHSVAQVQNRDKIKIKEIINSGYEPYVIKDMGKYKKQFVEEKFKEMLAYLKLS